MSTLPPPSAALPPSTPTAPPVPARRAWSRRTRWLLGAAVALPLALAGAAYLVHAAGHETTDDAYTTGNVHQISARVAGTVVEVAVDDNERVRRGQVLVRLDPRDFQVQVHKAEADFRRAQADFERAQALRGSLHGDIALSKQEYDQMEAALGGAQAVLDDARDQLDYCTIRAPEEGGVGDKTVQTGNRVAPGTVLLSVVQDCWIVANYKETQVARMRPGQRVRIHVDALPGRAFTGIVDSFSPGSGSVFALLPPENATGNFTKIVQRVPVKIRFDPAGIRGFEDKLVPGLSVETDVDLRSGP